jgi:hypothetical protein
MLDQNLLDKQYILESLVDLLEKNTVNNTTGTSSVLNNVTNQLQQSSSSLQKTLSSVGNNSQQSILNEFSTAKLILNTGNILFIKKIFFDL